jgi:CHAT domain-containing protein/tetratricopeptide (TPR) repeat protein
MPAIARIGNARGAAPETRPTTSRAEWEENEDKFQKRCTLLHAYHMLTAPDDTSLQHARQYAAKFHDLCEKGQYMEALGESATRRIRAWNPGAWVLPPNGSPPATRPDATPPLIFPPWQMYDATLNRALGEADVEYIQWLEDVAEALRGRGDYGDYSAAEAWSLKAERGARKLLKGHENPWYARILLHLAQAQMRNNKIPQAAATLRNALGIYERTVGGDQVGAAAILQFLGLTAQLSGRYEEAEQYFEEALRIVEHQPAGQVPPYVATALRSNLGSLALVKRDFAGARRQMQTVMAEMGPAQDDDPQKAGARAALLLQAGLLPMVEGSHDLTRLKEGEQYLTDACNIMQRKDVAGPDNPQTLPFLMMHAQFLLYRLGPGDLGKARLLIDDAKKITEENRLKQEGLEQVYSQEMFGYLALFAGRPEEAAQYAEKAIASTRKILGEQSPYLAEPLSLMGMSEMVMNHPDAAGKFLLESRERAKGDCDNAFKSLAEVAQLKAIHLFRNYLDRDLSFRSRFKLLDAVAYQGMLDWKGTILLHQRGRKGRQSAPVAPAAIQRALPKGTALVDILEYGHFEPSAAGMWVTENRYLAFVVRQDGIDAVELGPAAPIDATIEAWRHDNAFPPEQGRKLREMVWEKLRPHLHGARVVLVSPDGALAELPWAALPAGIVAAPANGPGDCLISTIVFATIPAPQLLPELAQSNPDRAATTRPSLLAVGDIPYDAKPASEFGQTGPTDKLSASAKRPLAVRGGRAGHFESLKFAADEMKAVEGLFTEHFGKPDQLRGEQATVWGFLKNAPGHRWLHVISHGFFAPANMRSAVSPATSLAPSLPSGGQTPAGELDPRELCGLALYGANNGPMLDPRTGQIRDDGILTARDVSEMNLTGTDLVVLSSCQSGLGEAVGGEGLLGLQRAFEAAGARSVIASLWSVDDGQTTRLMSEFYRQMLDGRLPPVLALRQAQLKLMRGDAALGQSRGPVEGAGGHRFSSSSAWAAWTLSGDPGDLKTILARMDEAPYAEPTGPAVVAKMERGAGMKWIVGASAGALAVVLALILIYLRRIET